jgi:hypothetical protein
MGIETKIDCAGGGQQQFTRPTSVSYRCQLTLSFECSHSVLMQTLTGKIVAALGTVRSMFLSLLLID